MIIRLKNKDTLIIGDFKLKCCIGKNGLKKLKKEGDNSTPVGTYSLGSLYFRNDRNIVPQTKLKKKSFIII
jgi:L,D-peptidoglycan transpeptidase YkuD (ErfK/YbiS/YcfS/YnhG family)